MSDYIGISEDKLHHILAVARKAYNIAKDMGYNENFARKMFMVGWMHDVGYEFAMDPKDHPMISNEMMHQLTCNEHIYDTPMCIKTSNAIYYHGAYPDESIKDNVEWQIINMADMMIDSKGNEVSVKYRLNEIKSRYGKDSAQYQNAYKICQVLELI